MPRRYKNNRQSEPPSGGGPGFVRRPGQYESRKLTMREEIIRVPLIIGTQCLLGIVSLLSLYLVMVSIGPIVGVVLIAIPIVYFAKKVNWGIQPLHHRFMPLFIAATIGILSTSYISLKSSWPANPIHFFHPLAQIFIIGGYTLSCGFSGWGVYILWIEITDPNHPSPRQAVLRDNPYIPFFSKETYGGQLLPEVATLPNLPSRTITVQLDKSGNGKHTESVAHIPDQSNWHHFFYAVAHHGKGFTEATARAYDVPLTDTRDQSGQLITIGMRTLREQFLARGWLEWKNQAVHERGLKVTTKGQRVMEAIGQNEKDN